MEKKYDFGGWATKANMKCSDGRVIKKMHSQNAMVLPCHWCGIISIIAQIRFWDMPYLKIERTGYTHMESLTIQRQDKMQNCSSRTAM